MVDRDTGVLRIGELSKRTGVSPELLRAWERRYGVLRPERTEGGFRLYTAADEDRVRSMLRSLERGLSAAEAARVADAEPEAASPPPAVAVSDDLVVDLEAALDGFDEAAANAALDRLFAAYSVEHVLREVILPYLHRVGDRWIAGEVTVAQEHFASNLLRSRLIALAGTWESGGGPMAILACPEGERHELALLCLGLSLRRRGWRIAYLGADTPLEAMTRAVVELHPASVVVSGTMEDAFDDVEGLRTLAVHGPVVLVGPRASDELAASIGARALTGDPLSAAAAL